MFIEYSVNEMHKMERTFGRIVKQICGSKLSEGKIIHAVRKAMRTEQPTCFQKCFQQAGAHLKAEIFEEVSGIIHSTTQPLRGLFVGHHIYLA